jgi:predicted amidohydrolase YtcJ
MDSKNIVIGWQHSTAARAEARLTKTIVAALAVCLWCAMPVLSAPADLILHNGKIVTVDSSFSVQQAVAIQNGRIVDIGQSADLLKQDRGPNTRVIDLHGRTVLPGLIDSHLHALSGGLSEYRAPLPQLHSFADIQRYVREQAAKVPKGQWIVVPRTFPTRLREMRMPTKEVLDVVTDHPVLFDASYVSVVNSYALKASGVTRNTPDPPRGAIGKDKNGEPNGILRNALSVIKGVPDTEHSDQFTHAEKLDALKKMLERYVAAGLTTVGDRAVLQEDVDLYNELKSKHELPVRAILTWRLPTKAPTDQLVSEIDKSTWVTNKGDDWLKFGSFKVALDGGMTIGTAYQRHPYGAFGAQLYGEANPQNRGQLFVPPDKLFAIMRAARDKGWQLTAHSQGGGAVDTLLDVFDKLDKEKPLRPTRSLLIHASFQSPEAIARMKRMGILADVQTIWLYWDGPALEKVFGHEGMRYFIPLRTYRNSGIVLAGGSDHMIGFDKNTAINGFNPFLSMWVAVARRMSNGEVLYPEERLTRKEALEMYTTWPAYMQFNEKNRGSLERGKLADMVVIDRDYLTCPEDDIRNIQPVMTILDGRIAYEAKPAKQ